MSWSEPENMGPAITGYDVRYRKGGSGTFRTMTTGTGTTATIAPESDGNAANGDERSRPAPPTRCPCGPRTTKSQPVVGGRHGEDEPGNSEPIFNDRRGTAKGTDFTTPRTVAENTRPGQSVGRAVRAVDGDGDTRTYRLVTAATDIRTRWPSSTSTSRPGRY